MKTVLITGSNGAIGQGLCKGFAENNYRVIGIDLDACSVGDTSSYLSIDLNRLCIDSNYCNQAIKDIFNSCENRLDVLINNAATQIIAPIKILSFDSWKKTININLNSAFVLIKALLPMLEEVRGNVINIASIHAQLTKPEFSAYATSKSGLIGLTKSLSVELGALIKINAISPAAISTPMLEAGFDGDQKLRNKLNSYHPTSDIGTVGDVVSVALYLSQCGIFINGSIIDIDGGISSRLHDPM
jgi:NAD(P)-dependent dehydrogenase (short-subunit alcohol dehydrogenase family)